MNKVTLFGRVSQKSELRQTSSGTDVINFSVATGYGERVTFVPVTAWNKQAGVISQYVNKGDQVLVEGHITASNNVRHDVKITEYKVTADFVHLIGSKSDGGGKDSFETTEKNPYDYQLKEPERKAPPVDTDSDLPF